MLFVSNNYNLYAYTKPYTGGVDSNSFVYFMYFLFNTNILCYSLFITHSYYHYHYLPLTCVYLYHLSCSYSFTVHMLLRIYKYKQYNTQKDQVH